MKKISKLISGVTLLEIMLVLAIAAMVIVMSVRYYSSATASQQANALLQQIQAISASADSLAQGAGGYSAAGLTSATLGALLPTNGLKTPWNTTIAIGTATPTMYPVTIPTPPKAVCSIVISKLLLNSKFTNLTPATPAGCAGATQITYTYDSTK